MILVCSKEDFTPAPFDRVRWLGRDGDLERIKDFWPAEYPLTDKDWLTALDEGYRYGAIFDGDRIIAIGAEYRCSPREWEVVRVRTDRARRKRGYAKALVSFLTCDILGHHRVAVCETRDDNTAMIRTAKSVGYRVAE